MIANAKALDFLKSARDMLERCYIPWTFDDRKGGHCQLGCIMNVANDAGIGRAEQQDLIDLVASAARRLHPELDGMIARRQVHGSFDLDFFDLAPAVYINNHLGKGAILSVYDDEIARLEVAELCREESSERCFARRENETNGAVW